MKGRIPGNTKTKSIITAVLIIGFGSAMKQEISIIEGVIGFFTTPIIDMIVHGTFMAYLICTVLAIGTAFAGLVNGVRRIDRKKE